MIGNRVHRAIVPFGGNRSCARRIAAESKLSDLDPRHLGFPWNSIVCVRHLKWGTQGWPDLRSIAHRPALASATPDSAEVVWFLDTVEWLACLGRAAANSSLDRWWWRAFRPGLATSDPVPEAFLRHLPEGRLAWKRLETTGHARAVEARLGSATVARLERAWTESGLPGRASGNSVDRPIQTSFRSGNAADDSSRQNQSEPAESRYELVTVPAVNAHPGEAIQAIHPEPEAVAQTPFAADATAIEAPPPTFAPSPDSANTQVPESLSHEDLLLPGHPLDRRSAPRPSNPISDPHVFPIPSAPAGLESDPHEGDHSVESSRTEAARREDRGLPLASAPGRVFESEFAGLFFVLGALQSLGWIPDFTRPLDRGIGIDPLVYLARLGAHRFGKRFQHDPLSEWLACQFPSKRIKDAPPRLAELESLIASGLDMRIRRAIHFLCHRRADVLVSESRVDVFHPLDDHPLEIRMAGLDRDPGWIPGTCLDFRYHFGNGHP